MTNQPEKSVAEKAEAFRMRLRGIVNHADEEYFVKMYRDDLKAERKRCDEMVEAERKRVSDTLDAIAFQTIHEKRHTENIENGLMVHKERCMCKTCIEATRHAEMATLEQIAEALTQPNDK